MYFYIPLCIMEYLYVLWSTEFKINYFTRKCINNKIQYVDMFSYFYRFFISLDKNINLHFIKGCDVNDLLI